MNVTLIFANKITTYETRFEPDSYLTKAEMVVSVDDYGARLQIWSALKPVPGSEGEEGEYDDMLEVSGHYIDGFRAGEPITLDEFMDAAYAEHGLLAIEVDGVVRARWESGPEDAPDVFK